MALVLDSTVGTLTANSYASVADADAYFESALPTEETAWQALTTAQKERYLVWATRVLDDSYYFIGRRASEGNGQTDGQALEWPRKGVPRDGWSALERRRPPYDLRNTGYWAGNYGYRDLIELDGLSELESNVIPLEVKHATAQMAQSLATSDRTSDSTLTELKSISAEGNQIEWREGGLPFSLGTIPSKVHDVIRKYGKYNPSLNSESVQSKTFRVGRG